MNLKSYLRPGQGAADITPLLANPQAFHYLIDQLAVLFLNTLATKLACVEGRGFLLGSALAYKLNLGLIPIRYPGKLKNATYDHTFIDYSGQSKTLTIHQDAITPEDKILIIDDWVETGATLKSTIELIERCQGQVAGIGAFMDDSNQELKDFLKRYNYQFLEKVEPRDNF